MSKSKNAQNAQTEQPANVSTIETPAQTVTNETPVATPAPAPAPAPEKTLDEKIAELKQLESDADDKYYDAKRAGNVDENELAKMKLSAYKYTMDIQKLKREHDAQIEMDKKRAEREQRAQIFTDFLKSIGVDETQFSDEQKTVATDIRTRLMDGIVKREIHIPAGMTGAKLQRENGGETKSAGGTKNDEIVTLFDAGKSYDEIIGMGYADGTIRTAANRNGYLKNRTNGTYYKKP